MLIATGVLLWRRRWPLAVLAVMAAVSLVQILALSPTAEFYAGLLPALVAVYSAGAHDDRWQRQGGLLAGIVTFSIERSAREALAEMRRLVGILHDDEGLALAPPPGLSSLSTLIENLRAAGLPVESATEGTPRKLAAGVDLSAYRIVQEALTNVVKHAGTATVSVRVRYQPQDLELLIEDDGGNPVAAPAAGGHGLIGMRERAAIYGGTLQAGARPGSGFTVRARFPLEPEPS
jgi:signal transduction histidine kinase